MSIPKHVTQKLDSQKATIERLTRQIAASDLQRAKAQMDCENMIDDIRAIINNKDTRTEEAIKKDLRNIINKQRGNPIEE